MLNVGLIVSTSYEKLSESAAAVVADYKLMNAQRRISLFAVRLLNELQFEWSFQMAGPRCTCQQQLDK